MTYPLLEKWGRTDVRLTNGTYINLSDPDYTQVPVWVLAEAVCYEFRYSMQGPRKYHVGEHLDLGCGLARRVAEVSNQRKRDLELGGSGDGIYFVDIDPDLAERAFASHDLHEGLTKDATRGMKRLNPAIESIEVVHYTRLRKVLGLPGPDHPVWALVKWVDNRMCFNEIAQIWGEEVPDNELYFLAADPDLPIRLEFRDSQTGYAKLAATLERLGWPCQR